MAYAVDGTKDLAACVETVSCTHVNKVMGYATSADCFRGIVLRCFQGLDEVMPVFGKTEDRSICNPPPRCNNMS